MIKKNSLKKFALGTAQLGSNYGITNINNGISNNEIKKILTKFNKEGGKIIDTSPNYISSEKLLGKNLPKRNNLLIISKLPKIKDKHITNKSIEKIETIFFNSLKNLKKKSIYALLIHSSKDLSKVGGKKIVNILINLKKKKLVKKIGVSIYSATELKKCLSIFTPDIVQFPINLIDHRMINTQYIKKLKKMGVEMMGRSLFLQGILTSKKVFSPIKNDFIRKKLEIVREEITKQRIKPIEACIFFGLQQKEIDKLIIGISSYEEFMEIQSVFNKDFKKFKWSSRFKLKNEKLLNPYNWS